MVRHLLPSVHESHRLAFRKLLGSVGVLTRVGRRRKKGGGRPSTVPSNPNKTYADEGWLSWGDWLGTDPGKVAEKR
jgi:hypothetical protein